MIHRFATYEDAALFTTLKRDQGYFAEVLHEHVGFLWGPLAMTGFLVLVSEFAADEGEQVPEPALAPPSVLDELRTALMLATVAIPSVFLVFGIVSVLGEILRMIVYYPRGALVWVFFPILKISVAVVFVCWLGWLLSELTRIYRDPDHRLHGAVRFAHESLAWLFIVLRPL